MTEDARSTPPSPLDEALVPLPIRTPGDEALDPQPVSGPGSAASRRTPGDEQPDPQPARPELLPGVLVGHDTDTRRPTGVTVVVLPPGTTAGVAVRGAAPGTRETDLLDPTNTVEAVDAIALCGGSAFGLDAAGGVMAWLEAAGRGVEVGPVRVPIVPAAVVFDLLVGDPKIRPDAGSGRRACAAAAPLPQASRGSVGAGAGATVGKLLGATSAMRGGVGIAWIRAGGITMAAVVVVNAMGDVVDPATGVVVAGARPVPDAAQPASSVDLLLGQLATGEAHAMPAANTTIGVVVTDAALTKTQASRLASVAHDGLARTIRPAHTTMDGDTLFAAATGTAAVPPPDMLILSMLAAEVTARAVLDAVRSATELRLDDLWLPAASPGARPTP